MLKSRLQPADEVATYHAYYEDLPVYLERYITVVGWKEEGEFNAPAESASSWTIDDATFRERWNGPVTIYMLTDRATYETLRHSPEQKFYLVAETNYDVLLSNKATPHSLVESHRQDGLPNRKQVGGGG